MLLVKEVNPCPKCRTNKFLVYNLKHDCGNLSCVACQTRGPAVDVKGKDLSHAHLEAACAWCDAYPQPEVDHTHGPARTENGKTHYLAQDIMETTRPVMFRNGFPLDARRQNLRIVEA